MACASMSFAPSARAATARGAQRAAAARRVAARAAAGEAANVGILGASGYTGAECCRLLAQHPGLNIKLMTAERHAGEGLEKCFPSLRAQADGLPTMVSVKDADFSDIDCVFCCLPHGTTQEIIAGLPEHVKVVDLSADFRLADIETYAQWYGAPHAAPDLQKEAVYGLTELAREEVKGARLVANPGCYPTCIQLPLNPLLSAGLIRPDGIIIDAKSGTSGAGRAAKEMTLYCEVTDGINAYGITAHRHVPEIEQGMVAALGGDADVKVSFTPHLMPMSRGMLATSYVNMAEGVSVGDLRAHLQKQYADEHFVIVCDEGVSPATRHVRGSNYCVVGVFEDRIPGRAIVISVIDNVCKGASGQALQNMNLVMGFEETTGLMMQPLFP